MVRSVLHKLRRRRRHWIAYLAAFALLFNQIALSQHLCLYRSGESPRTALVSHDHGNPPACHGASASKFSLTDSDATACAAHCDDGDKQTRDTTLLKVPDLFGLPSEIALLALSAVGDQSFAASTRPRVIHPYRTIDYGVLLI